MNKEAPKAWAGIPWVTEQPVIIQDARGNDLAVGWGAIIRPDSGTFWTEGLTHKHQRRQHLSSSAQHRQ